MHLCPFCNRRTINLLDDDDDDDEKSAHRAQPPPGRHRHWPGALAVGSRDVIESSLCTLYESLHRRITDIVVVVVVSL